jgi:hypothetical protein
VTQLSEVQPRNKIIEEIEQETRKLLESAKEQEQTKQQ